MNLLESSAHRAQSGLRIKVVGVGGAGMRFLESLRAGAWPNVSWAAVHTNARAISAATDVETLLLGAKVLRGLGSSGDPDLGRAVAEEAQLALRTLCAGQDIVFILGGLGGGTASGVAPILAREARAVGALTLAVVTLPFEFEGARRARLAELGLERLRASADSVLCLENQRVCRLVEENTPALEVFALASQMLCEGVRGVWHMLARDGLTSIELADLSAVLRGRPTESCFAAVEACGEGRSREIVERILAHPLLFEGQALASADVLLVSLTGGPDMTLGDVNRVTEQLQRQSEHAQTLVGASILPDWQGKLGVTVIAVRHLPESPHDHRSTGSDRCDVAPPSSGAIETQFFQAPTPLKAVARYRPPAPDLSPERREELWEKQKGRGSRSKKERSLWRQGQLPLEIVSKGRFEESEPTIHQGEDLDVPTYIRRGIRLN